MKTVTDIDNEYSTYLGEEIASINEFSIDAFIEIDHDQIKAKIDVSIKEGKFIGVDNVGHFHLTTSEGSTFKTYENKDINMILLIIKMLTGLEDEIIKQAYKQFEDDNESR